MNNEKDLQFLQKQADAYFLLGEKVHIQFKSASWKRGIIIQVSSEFFILDETLEGKQPIFFSQIANISKYNPKKEGFK